ncbi:MAG: YhdP family phospholipid transporter, partial [Janthinobacterium lividum]
MPDRRAPSDPADSSRSPPPANERAPNRGLRFLLRALLGLALVLYFGVGTAVLALRYGILPHIDAFRPRIEAAASKALRAPVHIGRLDARWPSLSPEITVSGLQVQGADGRPALRVDSARAVLAWRSLLHLKPIFTRLEIDGADLVATRGRDGRIAIAGVTLGKRGGNPYGFSNWLLAQRAIVIRHTALHWRDATRDAPELTLRDLRLALFNAGHAHRLGAQGAFDDPALGTLDLRAQFRHALFAGALDSLLEGRAGAIGNPKNWTGTVYLNSSTLDLVRLGRHVALPIAANAGRLQTQAWLHFTAGRPDQLSGALRGQDLALQVRPHLPALTLPRIALRFAAGRRGAAYFTSIRDVSFEVADQPDLPDGTPVTRVLDVARFDGAFRPASIGRGERISLSGDVVDIGLLADFSRALPMPTRLQHNLDRFDPQGVLTDYRATWERQAPADAAAASDARVHGNQPLQHYNVHARLDGVSLAAQPEAPGLNAAGHPHIGQPGFHNLRGVIDADEGGGHLTLASRDAALTIRGMFDAPTLTFDTLDGEARWTLSAPGGQPHLDARLTALHFANADAAGQLQARFQADLHHAGLGRLDLSGRLDRAAVPSIPRYLPTSIGAALRGYLAHAFLAGDTREARFDIHGRLPDLPYPHGVDTDGAPHEASVFRISAPFAHGKVDLSPHPAIILANGDEERWPAFDNVAGRFFVDGRRLGFDVTGGHFRGVQVNALAGRIADLGDTTRDLLI